MARGNYQSIYTGQQIDQRLTDVSNKVDKVAGKGLSANDYTNEDKAAVQSVPSKADKVASAVANNLAALDANGNLKDSGSKASDFEAAGAAASAVSTHNASAQAHATKFAEVNTRIDNISTRGRFLSGWMCNLGLPKDNPGTLPYTYKTGDYFIVDRLIDTAWPVLHNSDTDEGIAYPMPGTKMFEIEGVEVECKNYKLWDIAAGSYDLLGDYYWPVGEGQPTAGDTLYEGEETIHGQYVVASTSVGHNYKPNGSSFTGSASTELADAGVKVGDMYVYTTENWVLLHTAADVVNFDNIGGSPYDNTLLASALNGVDKVFVATYGSTTYAEIVAAKTAGKEVIVVISGTNYRLYNTDENFCYFSAQYSIEADIAYVSSINEWSNMPQELEAADNKVTSLSAGSTDDQYPSAKCVYDATKDKADKTTEEPLTYASGQTYTLTANEIATLNASSAASGDSISIALPASPAVTDEFDIRITTGSNALGITMPTGVTWNGGTTPTSLDANATYEINISGGLGLCVKF